jgi:hypothetical protein
LSAAQIIADDVDFVMVGAVLTRNGADLILRHGRVAGDH